MLWYLPAPAGLGAWEGLPSLEGIWVSFLGTVLLLHDLPMQWCWVGGRHRCLEAVQVE